MIRGLIPFKEHERVLRVVLALLHTALPIVCVTALSTSSAKPSVTDEPRLGRQERIEELMQKAFEAEDLAEQKEYYSEILGLDSSDQIALERLKEIQAKLEQRRKREKSTQLQHEMREPATKEKLDLGDKKEREAIEGAIGALSYDNLEQLKAVKQRIEDVLQVNPDSARLQNMRTTLEERISSKEN